MRESYFIQGVLYAHSCVATGDKQIKQVNIIIDSHFSNSLGFLIIEKIKY